MSGAGPLAYAVMVRLPRLVAGERLLPLRRTGVVFFFFFFFLNLGIAAAYAG